MYSITSEILEKKAPRYIGAGIHEVTLTDVEFKMSPSGKPLFAYTYKNDEGQMVVKTEWAINLPDNYDSLPENKKKGYEAARRNQMVRILKVATLFVPKEEFLDKKFMDTPDKSAFQAFAEYVEQKLKAAGHSAPLRVKTAYDKNGWITTPSYTYADNEWIERADKVSKEDSKIVMTSADVVIRPNPKADNTRKSSPLDDDANSSATPSINDNDPF